MKKLPFTKTPIKINYDVTYNCNANCKFCGVKKREKMTDLNTAKRVINELAKNNL